MAGVERDRKCAVLMLNILKRNGGRMSREALLAALSKELANANDDVDVAIANVRSNENA
jgi:hypothetical protein